MFASWKQLHRVKQTYKGHIFIISSETHSSRHHHIFNINTLGNFKLAVWPTNCWMEKLCFGNRLFKLGHIQWNLRSNMYQMLISYLFHNWHSKETETEITVPQYLDSPVKLTFRHIQAYASLPGLCFTSNCFTVWELT